MKRENDEIGQEVYDVMQHIRDNGMPPKIMQNPIYIETHSLIPIPFWKRFGVMWYILIGRSFHFTNNIVVTPTGMDNHARLNFEVDDANFGSEGL